MCLGQIRSPVLCPYPHHNQGVSDLIFRWQFYHQKICFHSERDLLPLWKIIPSTHEFGHNNCEDGSVRCCQSAWPSSLCILAAGSCHRPFRLFDTCNISWILSHTALAPGTLFSAFSILNYSEVCKAAFLTQLWAGAAEGAQGCGHPAGQTGSSGKELDTEAAQQALLATWGAGQPCNWGKPGRQHWSSVLAPTGTSCGISSL